MTTAEVVVIIGTTTTSLVTIISTIGLYWGKKELKRGLARANSRLLRAEDSRFQVARDLKDHLEDAKAKIDTVEANTNGTLSKAMAKIDRLEEALTKALSERDANGKDKVLVEAVTGSKSDKVA